MDPHRDDDAGLRKACPKATRARARRALQFNVPTHNKPWSSFRSSNKGDGLAMRLIIIKYKENERMQLHMFLNTNDATSDDQSSEVRAFVGQEF